MDTQALIWIAEGKAFPGFALTQAATQAVVDADELFVSHASLWEMAIKSALPGSRALQLSKPYGVWIDAVLSHGMIAKLPIREEHLKRVATLPPHHGDPFDRLIVAQALVEGIPIVSADGALDGYGVQRIG